MYLNDQEPASTEQLKPVIRWDQPFSFGDSRTTHYSSSDFLCRNIYLMALKVTLNLGLHLWKMQHKLGEKHLTHSILKNGRITPYVSPQVKRSSTTPNMGNLKNELLRLYSTIQFNSHVIQTFASLTRWVTWNVLTLCKWSPVKDSSYAGHVSNPSRKTKPLHCGVWPKFTQIEG